MEWTENQRLKARVQTQIPSCNWVMYWLVRYGQQLLFGQASPIMGRVKHMQWLSTAGGRAAWRVFDQVMTPLGIYHIELLIQEYKDNTNEDVYFSALCPRETLEKTLKIHKRGCD